MRRAEAGFALFEAIVALAIVAAVALPAHAVIARAIATAQRAEAEALKAELQLNALAALGTVNPMQDPNGQLDMGGTRLTWHARALTEPSQAVAYPRGLAPFSVGLFETRAEIVDASGRVIHSFTLRQVGHSRQSAPPPLPRSP
jgi:general secretion pathway protein I